MTRKSSLAMFADCARPVANLLRGRPVLATFQVTLRCNSACGYCDLPLNQGRYELTREEIRGIFGQLYTEGIRFVLVQGGEPLLRTDLVDILADLSSLGLQVTVITNGTRLTPDLVAHCASLRLPVSISLDTLDRARYRQIRGADQLPQVLSGLNLLARYPFPKFLTCIVSEANRDEVPEVVRFARRHGFIPVVGAYHWNVGLYGKEDTGLMYDRSAAAGVFELLLKEDLIPPGYFRKFVADSAVWLRGERLEPCDAGRYSIAIDASGQVSACLAMPAVGNLREVPYREILSRFDRSQVQACSDGSSCNRLDGRVVGTILRHPITAWRTPVRF
ncbi:MAG TPA: radical SAM protein [Nitrospira sp.]|nr:radical SAM protein [Nitrospira sp.]